MDRETDRVLLGPLATELVTESELFPLVPLVEIAVMCPAKADGKPKVTEPSDDVLFVV